MQGFKGMALPITALSTRSYFSKYPQTSKLSVIPLSNDSILCMPLSKSSNETLKFTGLQHSEGPKNAFKLLVMKQAATKMKIRNSKQQRNGKRPSHLHSTMGLFPIRTEDPFLVWGNHREVLAGSKTLDLFSSIHSC